MSDWTNGLQLPDEKPERASEKPMPLHEEKHAASENRHHETHHQHAEKKRTSARSKSSMTSLSQTQVGIGAVAILLIAVTSALAYRSTVNQARVANERSAAQSQSLISPTTWVAEQFVMTFTLPSAWEFTYSDTAAWIAQYKTGGLNGQLEVSVQPSSILDGVEGETKTSFAGAEASYSQSSQITFDAGIETRIVTVLSAVPHSEVAIRAQFNLQGLPDELTDEEVAIAVAQLKQILANAAIE